MTEPYTYDRFVPGALLGEWQETLGAEFHAQWKAIFGDDPADAPARASGLAVACMMRAYLSVVTPRPPGNIHARQRLTLSQAPEVGETIHSRIWCRDKELRKERRYLTLEVSASGTEGRPLYTGELSLIWAR